jgi:hypothetical protein
LCLELGAFDWFGGTTGGVPEVVHFSAKVSNTAKREENPEIGLLFVEEFEWSCQNGGAILFFTHFHGDQAHSFKGSTECPEPELTGKIGLLEIGSGHSDCNSPMTLYQTILRLAVGGRGENADVLAKQ